MDICILNSGFGSRLKKYTQFVPKGLVPLDGSTTILSRQLSILNMFGEHRYALTTGYLDGEIQRYLHVHFPDLKTEYFVNTRYAETNYITSLLLLEPRFQSELVLMHGDLVFEHSVVKDILESPRSVVVVDSTLPLPEKDFKARIKDGKVVEIGIHVFGDDCFACQPLYHLTKKDWNTWQTTISEYCARGEESVYAENALNSVSSRMDLYPLDVKGRLCMEIDNEADLLSARKLMENKRT